MKKTIIIAFILASLGAVAYAASAQCAWVNSNGGKCQKKALTGKQYCMEHNSRL